MVTVSTMAIIAVIQLEDFREEETQQEEIVYDDDPWGIGWPSEASVLPNLRKE